MTMRDFIRQNREAIDATIRQSRDFVPRTASCDCHRSGTDHVHENGTTIDNEDRRQWILNDEFLYRQARSAGVRI